MPNQIKTAILAAYRLATAPWRDRAMARLVKQRRAPILLLYYHRVADTECVPWSLTNGQFQAHLDWLMSRFEMISLEQAQQRIAGGDSPRPAAHITFDDGYAENLDAALPMLIRRQVPCTYFVTLENIVTGQPFAHDRQVGKRFPVNTVAQVRQLADQGIEIGAHTRTHPDLGAVHSAEQLVDEIAVAKYELEALLDRPVRYFAFPFGQPQNLGGTAVELARRAGFAGICSAYGGYNFPGDDAFHLQRCHGDPELARLKNTATLDPRHLLRRRPTFAVSADLSAATERLFDALPPAPPALPLVSVDAGRSTPSTISSPGSS